MASGNDDKIVEEVVGRLEIVHPNVSTELLRNRVWENLKSFVNPAIRDFLPVLVERRVRRELKSASL